jgi:hypothetical protein
VNKKLWAGQFKIARVFLDLESKNQEIIKMVNQVKVHVQRVFAVRVIFECLSGIFVS